MRISDWSSDVCSSDLIASAVISQGLIEIERRALHPDQWPGMANPYISIASEECSPHPFRSCPEKAGIISRAHGRSEEHTSELQSLMRISYAVFCLNKKKKHRPH